MCYDDADRHPYCFYLLPHTHPYPDTDPHTTLAYPDPFVRGERDEPLRPEPLPREHDVWRGQSSDGDSPLWD